jgi:hypothetical protein
MYGEGNPLAYIDPLGLCATSSGGGVNWGGIYDDIVGGAQWTGYFLEALFTSTEGLQGGASILANTFTFGGTDYLGWTDSSQYQGWEYDASRAFANVGRGATIGLATAGLGTLAAGGSTVAQVGYGGVLAANAGYGGYQVGSGINSVIDGNYITGAGQILGGGLSLYGSYAGASTLANATVNQGTTAVLKNGYYEVNGVKFNEYYYNKLWDTGRGAPSLVANEILKTGAKGAPDVIKSGFFSYEALGWKMIYNPTTKEVWHLQPFK